MQHVGSYKKKQQELRRNNKRCLKTSKCMTAEARGDKLKKDPLNRSAKAQHDVNMLIESTTAKNIKTNTWIGDTLVSY